jgi:hypothetical protein
LRECVNTALAAHNVSNLQVQTSQYGPLLGTQFATDSEFRLNSHAQLRCLSGRELIHVLFDDRFVNWLSIERLIKSHICLTQPAIGGLALRFGLLEDHSNSLSLFRRQPELFDGIGRIVLRRVLHRKPWFG